MLPKKPGRHRKPVVVILVLFVASIARAGSDGVETAGSIGRVLIPAAAAGITLVKKDFEGTKQLVASLAVSAVVTEGLKYTIRERSPKGEEHSFPSGHASIAFAGATFLQVRYGWEYGIPAFLAAAFVGYSRVESDEHWTKDVVGGAAIGIASGLIFTSQYRKEPGQVFLFPLIGKKSTGIGLSTTF